MAYNCFCVSYDLNDPGQHYEALYNELKSSSGWWHYLDSTWLISTAETADQLAHRLYGVIDKNDRLLVIAVGRDNQGWLPKAAWDWINRHT
jgi:hypothetical protein